MKYSNLIIIALLLGITIFSISKYISSLRSVEEYKNELALIKIENKNLVQSLEKDKVLQETLIAENESLSECILETNEQLSGLQEGFDALKQNQSLLETQVVLLRQENQRLNLQMTELAEEKELLAQQMSSVSGLKKMLNDLRSRRRQGRSKELCISKNFEEDYEEEFSGGNRGFLLKDGTSTYTSKIKIEVRPVEN
jgi:cell division protein YceG involved in septum cleavage